MNKYSIFLKSGHKIEINYQEEDNKNLIGLWVWASRQKDIKILTLVDGLTGTQHAVSSEEIATITQSGYNPHTQTPTPTTFSAKERDLIKEKEAEDAYRVKMEEDFENLVQTTLGHQEESEPKYSGKRFDKGGSAPRKWNPF